MQIYEYTCAECGARFEMLVRSFSGSTSIECPHCHSRETRKEISLFSAPSSGSSADGGASCAPTGG